MFLLTLLTLWKLKAVAAGAVRDLAGCLRHTAPVPPLGQAVAVRGHLAEWVWWAVPSDREGDRRNCWVQNAGFPGSEGSNCCPWRQLHVIWRACGPSRGVSPWAGSPGQTGLCSKRCSRWWCSEGKLLFCGTALEVWEDADGCWVTYRLGFTNVPAWCECMKDGNSPSLVAFPLSWRLTYWYAQFPVEASAFPLRCVLVPCLVGGAEQCCLLLPEHGAEVCPCAWCRYLVQGSLASNGNLRYLTPRSSCAVLAKLEKNITGWWYFQYDKLP